MTLNDVNPATKTKGNDRLEQSEAMTDMQRVSVGR